MSKSISQSPVGSIWWINHIKIGSIYQQQLKWNRTKSIYFLLTEAFADLRIVHLRILLGDLTPLQPRPDHERVHGSLDVVLLFLGGLARGEPLRYSEGCPAKRGHPREALGRAEAPLAHRPHRPETHTPITRVFHLCLAPKTYFGIWFFRAVDSKICSCFRPIFLIMLMANTTNILFSWGSCEALF